MFTTSQQTPNQWHATPVTHNARYAGWLNSSAQHLDVPSLSRRKRTERHVTFDIPSDSLHDQHAAHTHRQSVHPQYETHPRTTSLMQDRRSPDITGIFGYLRGSTPQGGFETRTGTRHDEENTEIRHDPPGRRTKNPVSSTVSTQMDIARPAYIHTLLAPPPILLSLIYDLRYSPNSLSFPSSSSYAGCGTEVLCVPVTPLRPRQIRLISPDFPWTFDIRGTRGDGVTCLEILTMLHTALQRPLTDTEWGAAGEDKRANLLRSRDSRLAIIPGENPGASTRPRTRFANTDQEPAHREPALLCVDWLGSRVVFGGLIKDDAFAKRRLIPGAEERPETWVVNLVS